MLGESIKDLGDKLTVTHIDLLDLLASRLRKETQALVDSNLSLNKVGI